VTIDGVASGKVLSPTTIEELAELIGNEKGSIVPMGGSTHMNFGNPLKGADCVVDLKGIRRITTYNPAELTIHVEAGATLGEIQGALSENGQALPLDPWNGPEATIGGIAAANAQGPLRATGTIRDWIIGMTVVHVGGTISKTGGRVVKNVTGYDLAKLYTGSLGSLVVIAEISFKLRPRFERIATAVAKFASLADAADLLARLRKTALQPISCELAGPKHSIWIRFGEHPRAVDWQISQLPQADWQLLEGPDETAAWAELRNQYLSMGPTVIRVVGLPTEIQGIVETFQPSSWIAHALNGIVLMTVPDAQAIAQVRERFPVIIEKAPADVRRSAGTFGVSGPARKLIQDMKRAFDPEGRLNPGRHIDGE
jgi:glycolate oxidase FAD binding subunit